MQIHGLTDILAGHPVFRDFDTDTLDVTLDIERLGSITSIPLLEIRR